MRLSSFGAFLIVLLMSAWAPNALAVASCAACFKGGFESGCTTCARVAEAAFSTIDLAITASETAILASTGMAPPNPTVGFPALQDMISVASGKQTKSLVSALDASVKMIAASIQAVPAVRVQMETNVALAQADLLDEGEAGCRAIGYGQTSGLNGHSSLSSGFAWLKGESFISRPSQSPGDPVPPVTSEQGAAVITANLQDQAYARVGAQLRELRENSGNPEAGSAELLNPSLLVSDSGRILSDEPDDSGISDSERMDLLIQYLTIDRPSAGDFVDPTASSPAVLKRATSEKLVAMEAGMGMAVLNKLMMARQKQSASLGSEQYLRAVMSEDNLELASDDDFTYLTTHYRANDPAWIAKVELSDSYAIKQYTQMEAEQLSHKYKRWVLKRDTNLLLSQIVANVVEEEH